MGHDSQFRNPEATVIAWPGLGTRTVSVGGVIVSCTDAVAAADILAASNASAIKSILAKAGNPLAACDYWAACRPHLPAARAALAPTGGIGPRGRHLAKDAFARAIRVAVTAELHAAIAAIRAAFSTDERYAAAIAADAVACRERDHREWLRKWAQAAIVSAVRQCTAADGARRCARAEACGTGSCPFADPALRSFLAPAEPGKFAARPPCHQQAGTGFSEAPAAAALLAARPWRPAVYVSDADSALVRDEVAAA